MRTLYLVLILLAACWANAVGQTYLKPNEYQQRLNNGLHLFYTQINGAKEHEVMLAYRFGAMAEDSTTDGLAYVCHTVFLNGLQQSLKQVDANVKLNGRFGHEVCTYAFKIPTAKFEQAMEAIAKYYAQAPDSNAFSNAIVQNAMLTGVVQNTVMYPAEQALLRRQWGNRSASMSIYGKVEVADSATIAKAKELYRSAYCIEFALMVFSGPEFFRDSWSKVQNLLGYVSSCRGELYNTKMANLFPKPKLSSQLVYNVGTATPSRYQKMYHGPYVSYDPEGTLAAQLLKTLFIQSSTLDALADSLGIAQLRMAHDPMMFAGSLTWHIVPAKDSLHAAYFNFDTLIAQLTTENIIPASEIETAKSSMVQQYEAIRNHPSQKMHLVAQYWSMSVMHWLGDYPAMINAVSGNQLSDVVSRYIQNQKYTTLMLLNDGDSSIYDINRFTTTYNSIAGITFHYQKNRAVFASPADDSTLNALSQTLLINRNIVITLNSQAHEAELLDVKDDSLSAELNQYEGFYIYPKNIRGKKTFRLDIYRTAKLMVALIKRGVYPSQLIGTGILLKGADEEKYQTVVAPAY